MLRQHCPVSMRIVEWLPRASDSKYSSTKSAVSEERDRKSRCHGGNMRRQNGKSPTSGTQASAARAIDKSLITHAS